MTREIQDTTSSQSLAAQAAAAHKPPSTWPARLDRVSLRAFGVSVVYMIVAIDYAVAQHAGLLDPNSPLFNLLARLAR